MITVMNLMKHASGIVVHVYRVKDKDAHDCHRMRLGYVYAPKRFWKAANATAPIPKSEPWHWPHAVLTDDPAQGVQDLHAEAIALCAARGLDTDL